MSTLPHKTANPFKVEPNSISDEDLGLATAAAPAPSLWGIPLKYVSLVTLAVQNSMLTIIMHYSRVSIPSSRMYSAAAAVLMNEVLKGSISLLIAYCRIESNIGTESLLLPGLQPKVFLSKFKKLSRDIFSADCWKLSIPAVLYVIQNNLQYVAASNLPAATFQVSYQMKILTTAAFSVVMLRKKLTSLQWVSLLALAIGVGIVQIQSGVAAHHGSSMEISTMNASKGFLAVVAACFTSGLAGVYFEMVLKNSQADLWVRNVQLSLFSLLPCIAHIVFSDSAVPFGSSGWFSSLFRNFGPWAWATILVQVLGGLVTAMVIKYSDNILKGFATSLSIVISFLASVALFDFRMTWPFIIGSVVVLNATWMYNQHPQRFRLASGRDLKAWSTSLQEKWRGESPSRAPSVSPIFEVTSSSISRTGSLISLSPSTSSSNLHEKFAYGH
ncbi:nucleotide-sugar transporter-domain-containing protein [Lentinula raphanica]|uniref:Nucleotide-sugar transporter-domain-containing protein n=1 Tax=Lentinula raphanica TaxID=153919 RepID=A0AA38UIT2_9AGAR|nr:nucleotide-sugar transporter-domain-containing protein [Lentinula raphanica]KAJ3842491.1 nucleotide-sugar transporter-domain-containing protein [Lentinula raphanica]KAJ3969325.1 nucleotide-sugar transporter-domain-containing protein [Lentinula raphanica]